jgi:hypothetical protein
MNEKLRFWLKTTQIESFEGLIMLELWLWKLVVKEIERINWYGVPIKLWLDLINDIENLIEEWISLRT